jgi:hypothetical protein
MVEAVGRKPQLGYFYFLRELSAGWHLGVHLGIGAGGVTKLLCNPGLVLEVDGGFAGKVEEDGMP